MGRSSLLTVDFVNRTYRDQSREAVHYRFITGGACLDVLTKTDPNFTLVRCLARNEPEPGQV